MKNSLYIMAALLVVVWAIIFFGFNSSEITHILLAAAGFVLIIQLFVLRESSQADDIHSTLM